MRFLVLPLALMVLNPWGALAQDAAETPSAEGEAAAEQDAATESAEAPAPPEFNGSASGTVMGAPLSAQVVCNIAGNSWTVQSDPGDAPGEDGNGDGNLVDISANAASGDIILNVLAGGMYVTFQDTGAQFEGNSMRYSVVVSMAGSEDERIDIQVNCS